jgi:MFS family permease
MKTRKNVILFFACTAVFFEALDIAIINLAIPLIQKQFTIPNDSIHWAQTLYILLYGGFLIVGGKLSDLLGRKRMFMVGSSLFLITSLGAGISPDFTFLVGFRALQGLAAALVMPAALSIITNTFTEIEERSRAIGIFSSFAAIGSGSGLSLGGLLATFLGWQWIFFINVPVIALTLWMSAIYIPKDEPDQQQNRPDIFSGLLLTIVVLLLSYFVHALNEIRSNGMILGSMFILIIMIALWFIHRSRKQQYPLIDTTLFQNQSTRTGLIATIILGAYFTSYLFVISLIFQSNMKYSAATTGLLLFPFSILSAITGKFFIPFFLRKMSAIQTAVLGMVSMLTGGILLLICMNTDYPLALVLTSAACVTGLGIAILFTSLMIMSVQSVPVEHHGVATGLVSTFYFLGGGLGLTVLSIFMHSDTNVNTSSVLVLVLYAMIGIAVLFGVIRKYAAAEFARFV